MRLSSPTPTGGGFVRGGMFDPLPTIVYHVIMADEFRGRLSLLSPDVLLSRVRRFRSIPTTHRTKADFIYLVQSDFAQQSDSFPPRARAIRFLLACQFIHDRYRTVVASGSFCVRRPIGTLYCMPGARHCAHGARYQHGDHEDCLRATRETILGSASGYSPTGY